MWDAGSALAVVIGLASLAGLMAAAGLVLGIYYLEFGSSPRIRWKPQIDVRF